MSTPIFARRTRTTSGRPALVKPLHFFLAVLALSGCVANNPQRTADSGGRPKPAASASAPAQKAAAPSADKAAASPSSASGPEYFELFEPLVTCKSFASFDKAEKSLIKLVGPVPDKMGERTYNLEKAGLTAFNKPVAVARFFGALASDYAAVAISVRAPISEMRNLAKKAGKGDFTVRSVKGGMTEITCMIGQF